MAALVSASIDQQAGGTDNHQVDRHPGRVEQRHQPSRRARSADVAQQCWCAGEPACTESSTRCSVRRPRCARTTPSLAPTGAAADSKVDANISNSASR